MKRHFLEHLDQVNKREEQLLSKVLECFEKNKRNTLKDLAILKVKLEIAEIQGGKK
jgi:hypothetical protein